MVPAGDPRAGEGKGAVSPHLVREQLARILRSSRFMEAPTLTRLLQHLIEQTLQGDPGQLKEYSVGLEVFNRGPSFDPHTDTIVRVHARRLRKRLDEYATRLKAGPIPSSLASPKVTTRWSGAWRPPASAPSKPSRLAAQCRLWCSRSRTSAAMATTSTSPRGSPTRSSTRWHCCRASTWWPGRRPSSSRDATKTSARLARPWALRWRSKAASDATDIRFEWPLS